MVYETLEQVIPIKDKQKLHDAAEKRYLILRNAIIEDKGMPNLVEEVKQIINQASKHDQNFNQFLIPGQVDKEALGLQDERMQRHKAMVLIQENMMKMDNITNPPQTYHR